MMWSDVSLKVDFDSTPCDTNPHHASYNKKTNADYREKYFTQSFIQYHKQQWAHMNVLMKDNTIYFL